MHVAVLIAAAALADDGPHEPVRCTPDSSAQVGWVERQPDFVPPVDVTPEFFALYTAATTDYRRKAGRARLPAEAPEHTYFLVKGVFGDHFPGYLHQARRSLRRLGLHAKLLDVDTDLSVATNAAVVRDAVVAERARTGRDSVVIGHSKGGVDALAALALYPDLAADVRAVVALQSPYGGSPIADDLVACPGVHRVVDGLIVDLLNGAPDALHDLTYASRQAFVAAHPLPDTVPVVAVATSKPPRPGQILLPTVKYLDARYGLPSDGLVVPDDAVVPGARLVRLDDLSHADPVLRHVVGGSLWPRALAEVFAELALEAPK